MSEKDQLRKQNLLKAKGPEAKAMNIVDHQQEEDFKSSMLLLILTGLPNLASLLMVTLQEVDLPLILTCASLFQKKVSQFNHVGNL